jgi:ROS/MUCR transcriptional regulator protein
MAIRTIMTSIAATAVNRSPRARSHAHLWSLPDGTGLHAPYGELVIESGTGRVCCHLCGRWYVSLGSHLRKHGHTADSYRYTMGLCRTRPLVAESLSRSIATRQTEAYQRCPELRARLAAGQEFSKTGRLTSLARTASASQEGVRIRNAALEAGRATRAAQRDQALARRLRELGFDELGDFLRQAYSDGTSLRNLTKMTGLGWGRLRREIDAAGITVRSSHPRSGQQSCAMAAIAR